MELGICNLLDYALDIGRSKRPLPSYKLKERMDGLLEALDGALHQE